MQCIARLSVDDCDDCSSCLIFCVLIAPKYAIWEVLKRLTARPADRDATDRQMAARSRQSANSSDTWENSHHLRLSMIGKRQVGNRKE